MQHFFAISNPKLKWVKQELNTKICGQCCIAMITGLPLDIIFEQMRSRTSTTLRQVADTLLWFGWDLDIVARHDEPSGMCLLHLKQKGNRHYGHWAVYYDGMIYDSCIGVFHYTKEAMDACGYRLVKHFKVNS